MDERNKFEVTEITNEELDEENGSHLRHNVGDCFINKNHYYMQRKTDILHVYDKIINTLHNSMLDVKFEKISKEEFENKLKTTIFDMDIYQYVREL